MTESIKAWLHNPMLITNETVYWSVTVVLWLATIYATYLLVKYILESEHTNDHIVFVGIGFAAVSSISFVWPIILCVIIYLCPVALPFTGVLLLAKKNIKKEAEDNEVIKDIIT